MQRPEDVWLVDPEFKGLYEQVRLRGAEEAGRASVNIVAIARNSTPALTNTLALAEEVMAGFGSGRMFVFENDSGDDTAAELDRFAASHEWCSVEHATWGGIDSRGFERERTERLARARNVCFDWVREHGSDRDYTIVLDTDPDYGFSVDGVFNSVGWLRDIERAGAMASYSLYRVTDEKGGVGIAHYDAWAARLNWWRDRRDEPAGFSWFAMLLPPVGSPPIAMNSAFGGLCVYKTSAFLAGGYSGEDCEHVPHHRRMAERGWQLLLNPGCRYIAIWR